MKALLFAPLGLLIIGLARYSAENGRVKEISKTQPVKHSTNELFDSDELLNIKFTGNVRDAFNDRSEKPKYQTFSLYYPSSDGSQARTTVRVRTRGHFRKDKSNCSYPPLLLNFTNKDQSPSSLFYNRDKVKLVMPCKGDEYVVKEYLV